MQVVILGIEPERVRAHVIGTEDYRTELVGRGKQPNPQLLLQTHGRGGARGQCHRQ
jgi:hypothetical protein